VILNLCAGPGGMDQGARVAGVIEPIYGYDIDADACATAVMAGFHRARASVTDLNPDDFRGATVALITPPCPPFSRAGLGRGLADFPAISTSLTALGDYFAGMVAERAYLDGLASLNDPRSALVVETLRFAFLLPDVRVVIAEQVPGVAPVWREVGAELAMTADWIYIAVVEIAAEDLGAASRRTRTFLIACRDYQPDLTGLPMRTLWTTGRYGGPPANEPVPLCEAFPSTSMAAALGWPKGEMVNTRGNRRATGGNLFSADGPAWCLTEKARTWYRVSDGLRLTEADAGLLVGFDKSHPWQGSRTKCFLQAADVVSPVVAAAVIGAALGVKDWPRRVRSYLSTIYPTPRPVGRYVQATLFDDMEIAS
jgi:DNA (cytosine-5)-methyltransferase 1